MVLVPQACLIWGPAFEMCNINIMLFVFSAVVSPENTGQFLSCVRDLMFIPFSIQVKFFMNIETFYGKSEKSSGGYSLCGWVLLWESGVYPGVRVACLSSPKETRRVAGLSGAGGPDFPGCGSCRAWCGVWALRHNICSGILGGDG